MFWKEVLGLIPKLTGKVVPVEAEMFAAHVL